MWPELGTCSSAAHAPSQHRQQELVIACLLQQRASATCTCHGRASSRTAQDLVLQPPAVTDLRPRLEHGGQHPQLALLGPAVDQARHLWAKASAVSKGMPELSSCQRLLSVPHLESPMGQLVSEPPSFSEDRQRAVLCVQSELGWDVWVSGCAPLARPQALLAAGDRP